MKRALIIIVVAVVSIAIFAGLVHLVLVAANLSEPNATTVQGMTPGRIWATIAALLGLVSVFAGLVTLRRSMQPHRLRNIAIFTVIGGLVAAVNGVLNLAVATGGPGTGNGVVGGAAAIVLGLIAACLGGLALARSRNAS